MSNTRRSRLSQRSRDSRARNVEVLANYLERQPAGLVEPQTVRLIQHYVGRELSPEDEDAIRSDFDRIDAFLYNFKVVMDCLNQVDRFEAILNDIQAQYHQNGRHGRLTQEDRNQLGQLASALNRWVIYFPGLSMRMGTRRVLEHITREMEMDDLWLSEVSNLFSEFVQIAERAQHVPRPDLGKIQEWMADIQQLLDEGEILPEFVPEIREENRAIEYELVRALNRIRL